MLASIIINNYNYGRFLRDAIDSALNQSYPHVEIIVVDDGSADNSREIIASYGTRITSILKENEGQASAVNVGFAASQGDVICLLDSDDVFLSEKVALVIQALRENPGACLVYHKMQKVNVTMEKKIGKPSPRAVWQGDIRRKVEASGGWWPHGSTSGLRFSRSYLERMFPLPVDASVWPDAYLAGPAPFFGAVIGIPVPLTLHRLHELNQSREIRVKRQNGRQLKRESLQSRLNRFVKEFDMQKEALPTRLNIPTFISLDDHIRYQRDRWALGEPVSLIKVLATTIRCQTLPFSMKWREVVKLLVSGCRKSALSRTEHFLQLRHQSKIE